MAPFLLLLPRMRWKSPCHPICAYRARTEPATACSPKNWSKMWFEERILSVQRCCAHGMCHKWARDLQTDLLVQILLVKHEHGYFHVWPLCFSAWLQTPSPCWHLKLQRTEKRVSGTNKKKKNSTFLMSFPLVYCSSCKSSLRIASCQIPSPKTHWSFQCPQDSFS